MQSPPLEDVQEPEASLPVVIASDGRGDVALRRTGPMIAPLAAPEERRRRGRPSQSRKKIAAGPDSLPPPADRHRSKGGPLLPGAGFLDPDPAGKDRSRSSRVTTGSPCIDQEHHN